MEMNNEWVKDPKVFNINREKAHASIHRYASLEEMHTNKSSYIYSLNGKWKFHYANGFNQLIGSLTVVSNFLLTKSLKTLIISMLLSFFIVKFVKINVLIWANVCYNRHRR